jgi:ABC-type proline/glycine betaine transport system ATPase subunit
VIELDRLRKRFDRDWVVDDLSLRVAPGELVVLLGGSGSGKTTTLKMVNRLVEPTSGCVLRHELDLTVIFVTHDMTEALLLGDRIAVLNAGRLVQVGRPAELLRDPADDYVAELMATPRRQAGVVDRFLAATDASDGD